MSRVLSYSAEYKSQSESLAAFIRRKNGINECAARFIRCLGGATTSHRQPCRTEPTSQRSPSATRSFTPLVPAARFARNLGQNLSVGVEYYTDLGPLQSWLPFNEQQHNVYGVVDFKIGRFDVNAGVGYGLTPGSDRLIAKMIIGTDLTEGASDKSSDGSKTLRRLESRVGGLSRP